MKDCSSSSKSLTAAALICPKPTKVASWISVKSTRSSGMTILRSSVRETEDWTTEGRYESNMSSAELLSGEDTTSE